MRRRVHDLRAALLALSPPVCVVPHSRADVDALSSAHGVAHFLRSHGISAEVCAPSVSATAALAEGRLGYAHSNRCNVSGRDVVVVDTSSSQMLPCDLSSARNVMVIDHHRGGDLRGFVFDAPATAAVVLELLDYSAPCSLLQFLAAGVVADTAGLYAADADALDSLARVLSRCGSHVSDILELLDSQPSIYERIARLRALERMKIYAIGDYILVVSRVGSFEGSSAWMLVQAGADIAVVGGKDRISARLSSRFVKETGVSLEDVFSRLALEYGGSWGGHAAAAGMHTDAVDTVLKAIPSVVSSLLRERGLAHTLRSY